MGHVGPHVRFMLLFCYVVDTWLLGIVRAYMEPRTTNPELKTRKPKHYRCFSALQGCAGPGGKGAFLRNTARYPKELQWEPQKREPHGNPKNIVGISPQLPIIVLPIWYYRVWGDIGFGDVLGLGFKLLYYGHIVNNKVSDILEVPCLGVPLTVLLIPWTRPRSPAWRSFHPSTNYSRLGRRGWQY